MKKEIEIDIEETKKLVKTLYTKGGIRGKVIGYLSNGITTYEDIIDTSDYKLFFDDETKWFWLQVGDNTTFPLGRITEQWGLCVTARQLEDYTSSVTRYHYYLSLIEKKILQYLKKYAKGL